MASIFRLLPPAQKISTRQEATALIKRLEPKRLIAFDTETTGLSRTRDYAVLLSLSDGEGRWAVWPSALPYFQEFLEFPGRRLIGHNVNFDQWMLLNVGIDLDRFTQTNYARCIDTMVMHALWDDSAPHDLKYLARQYLNIDMVPFKELYGAQLRTRPLKEIFLDPKNEAKTVNYSALDAYATFRLFLCLQRQLQDAKITEPESSYTDLWDYYLRSEIPFTKVLWHMERRGIALNEDTLLDRAPRLELEIANLLHWFCKQLRRFDVNLSSNPQMVALFFDKLGKQVLTRTAGGAPQLSKVALKTWAAQGCEYSKNLLAYRDKTKNLGT
ncbi:hypothetical protein FJZ55_06270, partial [Candidatus Woesearchaeota archaeon]|nr:hypothetical protein [Candidatus Woesearchaeota archaeon]